MVDEIDNMEWSPPRPIPPMFPVPSASSSFSTAMERIQSFINSFQYNYTNSPFVKPKKTGGSKHILEIYQLLIDLSLPIQCVEAVFISAVLTAPFREVVRIPLSFESKCEGHLHKHIVLAVLCNGQWGAMGISRRESLMYKPLQYPTLWSLIEDFDKSYQAVGHIVTLVAPGSPLPYDFTTVDLPILWKAAKLRLGAKQNAISKLELDSFLQLHGLVNNNTASSNKNLRKRAHSHTGASATSQYSDSSSHVGSHSHHSKLGSGKASYKAVVMRNAIAAASAACAMTDDAETGNNTPTITTKTGDYHCKPPRPQLAQSTITPNPSTSKPRGKVRATSFSSASAHAARRSPSPLPQQEHLSSSEKPLLLTSVSQPTTARYNIPSEPASPSPHQQIIDTEADLLQPYCASSNKEIVLDSGGMVRRRKTEKEIVSETEPLVSVEDDAVVTTVVKVKSANTHSQSSFLPPISHIRTTTHESFVAKTSRL